MFVSGVSATQLWENVNEMATIALDRVSTDIGGGFRVSRSLAMDAAGVPAAVGPAHGGVQAAVMRVTVAVAIGAVLAGHRFAHGYASAYAGSAPAYAESP